MCHVPEEEEGSGKGRSREEREGNMSRRNKRVGLLNDARRVGKGQVTEAEKMGFRS